MMLTPHYRMKEFKNVLEEDANYWIEMVREHIHENKDNELHQALIAFALDSSFGLEWVTWLKNNVDLPVTTNTIRNRVRWGKLVTTHDIDLEEATLMGMQRTFTLDDLSLLDDSEWRGKAAELSGTDWNREIKTFKGEDAEEFEDNRPCPVCDNPVDATKLPQRIKQFMMRNLGNSGLKEGAA